MMTQSLLNDYTTPMSSVAVEKDIFPDAQEEVDTEILKMSTDEILQRIRLLENDVKVCLSLFVSLMVTVVSLLSCILCIYLTLSSLPSSLTRPSHSLRYARSDHEIRKDAFRTRKIQHARKDKRQHRKDQTQQTTPVPRLKHCRDPPSRCRRRRGCQARYLLSLLQI